jgi:hypothetical protein
MQQHAYFFLRTEMIFLSLHDITQSAWRHVQHERIDEQCSPSHLFSDTTVNPSADKGYNACVYAALRHTGIYVRLELLFFLFTAENRTGCLTS